MGDSKRRKEMLGEKYGQEEPLFRWLPLTQSQVNQFMQWTTRGAWVGIGLLIFWWITVRFIGPSLGWWQLSS